MTKRTPTSMAKWGKMGGTNGGKAKVPKGFATMDPATKKSLQSKGGKATGKKGFAAMSIEQHRAILAKSSEFRKTKQTERREVWRQRISEQESTGHAIRAFCYEHGLKEGTFYDWRKHLRQNSVTSATAKPALLILCAVHPPPPPGQRKFPAIGTRSCNCYRSWCKSP